jgi:hypothetical protein
MQPLKWIILYGTSFDKDAFAGNLMIGFNLRCADVQHMTFGKFAVRMNCVWVCTTAQTG